MRAGAALLPALMALAALLAGCEGPVIVLPTPTGALPGPSFPGQPEPGVTPQPALLEHRQIILEWPLKVRERDSALILLTIAVDEQGNLTATAQSGGQPEPTPIDIPNIYDTHNIVAVARLDIAGVDANREEIRLPLLPGREVTFRWSIRASDAGLYRGVVWLHLELVSKAGGPIEEQLLLARTNEVEAVTVFGLPGGLARILGTLGIVASTVLGYPFIQRWMDTWSKRREKPPPQAPAAGQDQPASGEVEKPEK